MKTKEFIKRVEELGYICFTNESYIFVRKNYALIATIALHKMYRITLYTNDNKLGELCVEYAKTPIEERKGKEEEKKYYLRALDSTSAIMGRYLNFDKSCNIYFLHNNCQYSDYKTRFTKNEIDEIKKELNTDLLEFEQVLVED